MAKSKQKKYTLVFILTAFLMLIFSMAVSVGVLTIPYERFKTYLHLAFINQIAVPSAQSDGVSGLVITENDQIPTETHQPEEMAEEGTIIRTEFGTQYAVLSCEKLGFSVPVYWGSSAELLERGACQSTSSVVIGETGNVVIDAHVNTFSSDLDQIGKAGMKLYFIPNMAFSPIRQRDLVALKTRRKDMFSLLLQDKLTLYTCQAQVLGTSSTRIGVICDVVSKKFYPVERRKKGGGGAQG